LKDYKLTEEDKLNLTYEERKEEAKKKRKEEHKCNSCVWSTWTGLELHKGWMMSENQGGIFRFKILKGGENI
jgi:hypothetical protein